MQIAPSYPRFWTTDRQSLTGEALAVAQRAYEGAGAEGLTFDDSVAPEVTVTRSDKEQEEFDYTVALSHRQLPMQAANTSLVAIEEQLDKVQKSIARERPDLAKASWDITVVDGKIAVTGSLNDSDKEWLASRLNGNFALSSAVRTYMQAATDYLETTASNPKHGGQSPINARLVDYNFKDVKGQLEGKIAFKELIAATWKKYDFGPEIKVDPADFRGGDSLEMLALRLLPSKD
jgi:hypothetical protein